MRSEASETPTSRGLLAVCEEICNYRGVVLIEAPLGFGKSRLASALVLFDERFAHLSVSELIAAADGADEHRSVVIDGDEETVPPEVLTQICDPRVSGAEEQTIVVLGRDLSHLARWGEKRRAWRIGPSDLAFDQADIRDQAEHALVPAPPSNFAEELFVRTAGWPALVVAILQDLQLASVGQREVPGSQMAGSPAHGSQWTRGFNVQQLVQQCLDGVDSELHAALCQLSHLSVFSAPCLTAMVGPGGLVRARAAGVPITQRPDGWLQIAHPVNLALRAAGTFEILSAEMLGPILVAEGGLMFASRALLAAGNAAVAADLLCSVPGYHFDDHDQAEVAGMIRSLDSQLDPDPELSLLLARVHHNRAELEDQRRALQEAERRATDLGDERRRLEALAELLFLDLGRGNERGLSARLNYLEDQVTEQTMPSTRVRLREVRAMYLGQSPVLTDVYASITLFKDASYEWESLGEPGRAAWTLRLFAGTTCLHLGRYREAEAALDRAAVLVNDKPTSLVKTLELAARLAAFSGDRDRFTAHSTRAKSLLPGRNLNWINGFLSWSSMAMSALEGDRAGTLENYQRTEALLGALWDHHTGVVFLADAARYFSYVNDYGAAMSALGQALARRSEAALEVDLAELTVHARVGDASVVPKLAATIKDSGNLPFERRWNVDLECLVGSGRSGEKGTGLLDAASIEAKAVEVGLESLWKMLSAGLNVPGESGPDKVRLVLLGRFEISGVIDGELRPGHSTQLVKFLATLGSDVPVEVVIDMLWPDVDAERGRKRLRNVINRTRSALGPDAVERRGDLVGLGSRVESDLAEFRTLGTLALTGGADRHERVGIAVRALKLYEGELLPDDRYGDWVAAQREAVRMTAVGLLELVISHPTPDVVPTWLLETAARIGARTEELWVAVATFSKDAGAMECCRSAAERAKTIAVDLGFEPGLATKTLLDECR